ncbi:MAG: ParB N-terminal domain-containing protein [Deltaproteobacteria bacterium]|nr:ParB N-terminal domain-containing protein [Deltaproteobacteria bacterium]
MLTTKRFEYLPFAQIQLHPDLINHRNTDMQKVSHYQRDILKNGLLEPLVVWERAPGQLYLVGGFHRRQAIENIRKERPDYFDRVDTRVVGGDLDEMRALNLKLNADRVDTRITDFFDTVIYLNNANWSKERIGEFLDRSVTWIGEILRFAPSMPAQVRQLLADGKISWNKGKAICRALEDADPGKEREVLARQLALLKKTSKPAAKPLSFRGLKRNLLRFVEHDPLAVYQLRAGDLLALVTVLEGKNYETDDLERVQRVFPALLDGEGTESSRSRAAENTARAQRAAAAS